MKYSFRKSYQSSARHFGFAFTLAVALGSGVPVGLEAQVVVVPNNRAESDGNSQVTTPTGPATVRYMQIHDASQFATLPGPSLLTQFAWRPDQNPGQSGPRKATLRIYASTTKRSVNELSSTFEDNTGTNNTLVFNGTLTWATENEAGPGNTRRFDIVFPLTTPFLYNPADGNLLLELQQSADGSAINFDREAGSSVIGQVASPGSTNAASGNFGDSQVTQFTFEPPPEVTIRTSQVEVCWNSKSNFTYQLQFRSDLTANLWTPLGNCVQGSGSTKCLNDPIVPGQPQRFYRVVLTNCVPD